ncbi:restriction endonuclease subunit S [Limosilactobacillus fastidiosus]|uniref:Restriction endonuclease subunit S n=1 Tax=Limosilactobacillus fastidiosus TaxID=2759855 RepID=A0ABR6E8V3_9LACO|nr:restriction endonuclease subunit S [Limosilactobacillus fastidiosus]MBB1063623.1 restriction endonuclease subunit S [Limosilactobacillus fastidiosus]MCD7084198.1 restriction endonuclease subunit S [Limosilactobacillus fastidiosus]
MIDFHTFESVTLEDVAEYGRAKKHHTYPAGTSTLQISATRGQLGYLYEPSEVATKDVAIIPSAGINSRYFNIVLHKNIDEFMRKYATGINIKENEVGKFPIQLHNIETQKAIVRIFDFMDREENSIQQDIDNLSNLKKNLLSNMLI